MPAPAAILNLGGVGNITFLPPEGEPVAFDTGPGNALLDDLMLERTGAGFDRDGAAAGQGRADDGIVAALMRHPYFDAPPPKSLDRNAWSRAAVAPLSTPDAAATLTEFTVASVARALELLPAAPSVVVVCGGGARNPVLMARLGRRLSCRVLGAEALGWDGDAVEAQAFAYLAVRACRGLPITFPGTTGVGAPGDGRGAAPRGTPDRALTTGREKSGPKRHRQGTGKGFGRSFPRRPHDAAARGARHASHLRPRPRAGRRPAGRPGGAGLRTRASRMPAPHRRLPGPTPPRAGGSAPSRRRFAASSRWSAAASRASPCRSSTTTPAASRAPSTPSSSSCRCPASRRSRPRPSIPGAIEARRPGRSGEPSVEVGRGGPRDHGRSGPAPAARMSRSGKPPQSTPTAAMPALRAASLGPVGRVADYERAVCRQVEFGECAAAKMSGWGFERSASSDEVSTSVSPSMPAAAL